MEPGTREDRMREFEEGSAPIMIFTDAAGMGRIGRAGRDKALSAVAIVFVESKHLLPQDVTSDETSRFRDYTTAIGPEDGERAEEIILAFYKDNFQIRKEKVPTPYHAVDPAVPWFINTTGYPRRLALACYMSNTFYDYVKYEKAYRKNLVDEFYSEGKKGRGEGLEEAEGRLIQPAATTAYMKHGIRKKRRSRFVSAMISRPATVGDI
ncbi:hypothetical protein MMC22_005554 [Lobaria immixta]|nr:hypothetical protein [Lobaria immixta]